MGSINILLFISELVSKIGNVDLNNRLRFNTKAFKQLNNLSFVKDIPTFDDRKNYITVNERQAPVGTILKRPLDNFFQRITQWDIEYHYAVVLGTSEDGGELLIEMTKSRDVNIVTKQDFLVDKFSESDIDIYFTPKTAITRESIFEKAKKFEFELYDLLDLNCKIFVEYVIFNIPVPERKTDLKKLQLHLFCEIKASIYRLHLSNPDNKNYYDFIKKQLELAEVDKTRLNKTIAEEEKKAIK